MRIGRGVLGGLLVLIVVLSRHQRVARQFHYRPNTVGRVWRDCGSCGCWTVLDSEAPTGGEPTMLRSFEFHGLTFAVSTRSCCCNALNWTSFAISREVPCLCLDPIPCDLNEAMKQLDSPCQF